MNDLAVDQLRREAQEELLDVLAILLDVISAKVTSQHAWGPKLLAATLSGDANMEEVAVRNSLRAWKSVRSIERHRQYAPYAFSGTLIARS